MQRNALAHHVAGQQLRQEGQQQQEHSTRTRYSWYLLKFSVSSYRTSEQITHFAQLHAGRPRARAKQSGQHVVRRVLPECLPLLHLLCQPGRVILCLIMTHFHFDAPR